MGYLRWYPDVVLDFQMVKVQQAWRSWSTDSINIKGGWSKDGLPYPSRFETKKVYTLVIMGCIR